MFTMDIVEYDKKTWGIAVAELFATIYPGWDAHQCGRLIYDENHLLHVLTLLAVKDDLPIGQLNIFRVGKTAELGNLGYHVHPRWQRKGVATLLLNEALRKITDPFSDGLVVQTTESNNPSKAFAIYSGFTPATELLIASYRNDLKFLAYDDGVCFHRTKIRE